jgi:DNA polymerase I-like protein with 3'-5' exonuclease and polymerase domains
MQIHDELVFEYQSKDKRKIDAFAEEVEKCMVEALPLDVPVVVDWETGKNWREI